MRFNSLQDSQLIVIWLRIFDPINSGFIEEREWTSLLDSLSRGTLTKDSTILSRMFAENMAKNLTDNKCVNAKRQLDVGRLRQMLEQGKIDIKVFNQMIVGGLTGSVEMV